MTNVEQTALKAVIWTRFIPVNVKTGKRENHPNDFMEFAKDIELENKFADASFKDRVLALMKDRRNVVGI